MKKPQRRLLATTNAKVNKKTIAGRVLRDRGFAAGAGNRRGNKPMK